MRAPDGFRLVRNAHGRGGIVHIVEEIVKPHGTFWRSICGKWSVPRRAVDRDVVADMPGSLVCSSCQRCLRARAGGSPRQTVVDEINEIIASAFGGDA